MCPEQCLLPFLVRQHITQELALSGSAAGPQTLSCYCWGDFCLHCHTGVWLSSEMGTLNVEIFRHSGTGPTHREGDC